MARTSQVTFDARDPTVSAEFWSAALGYVRQPPPTGYDAWDTFALDKGIPADEWEKFDSIVDPDRDRPRLFFQSVSEGETAKNRMHLDLNLAAHDTADQDRREMVNDKVDRLVDLGATRLEDFDLEDSFGVWTVMQDPEGDKFFVQ